ncbi:MAG: transposase [Bacteroidales bacterium]|nr:transposase [Bacteroidales bacterium]
MIGRGEFHFRENQNMSLFQKSVEKKYLNDLDPSLIDKKYNDFQDYFADPERQENIRNSKEEQFQEGFLRELFVKILGYTLNPEPNFNLTTELKNIANSKKADGAILKGEDATAVIELKGTDTTDLDKIETQAFGYKNHHPKCKYVITSNFGKLRFYIQNAVDHVDFDLFNLTREQFSLMWLCLAKDNLLNDLPLKIKESSVLQEENITKKLYADYSKFRGAIFSNLVKNNPETDKLLLFKKTQKLLDRFLFIFFAEDRLLVPPNSISQIIEKWKDDVDFGDAKPLYETFKKYFHVLNVGRPKSGNRQEIYAYNGGLFKPDEVLDNITIDDDILFEHTLRLSNYDFETDVDVNILGHIFEHSLGEIENVQTEIAQEQAKAPLTVSKRKKDGIFYTPKYITKYIVENTVGKLCEEKRTELEIVDEEYAKGRKNRKKEIIKALDDKLTDYRNWLLSLTILDPACGSGAFLNQALEFLINEHRKIDELREQLLGGAIVFSDITTDILEKNIYGVDLNEESVEIAKLSLWLRTAQKGRKLNTLSNNIKCGNSLIDDPDVAGEKAFNWQIEFPDIFQKKKKKAWHVTWVTHDTRTSERMIKYKVRERRASGKMHVDRSVYLENGDALKVSEIITGIVIEDNYNCLAYNICNDHVHILLVCEEEELPNIVRKLKGKSAQKFKEHLGISKDETYNLWAQKFHRKPIKSDQQLLNVIEYIKTNRIKHGLPDMSKGLQPLAQRMTCTYDHAFRTEYKGGFDVVIGNPPYVRAELLGDFRENLEKNYSVFNPAGDLFSYFYEKSFQLLKLNGLFGFISNTFDKTTAGISVREFLQNGVQFLKYIDFTEVQIFEGATTYPVILIAKNQKETNQSFTYIKIPKSGQSVVIDIDFHDSVLVSQNLLNKENWSFKSNQAVGLIEKLQKNKTIREIYGKSFRGILTGLNEAFIISKSYQAGKHVKPIFEGKELEKWSIPESVQQLILFESKWTKGQYGDDVTESLALEKLTNDFPELISHILPFKERAIKRFDQGDFFWELRNCAYYSLFENPKIVFPNLQNSNKFAFDESGAYINAPAVILPTNDKFITAILNSKLVWYFLTNICVVRNGGYIEVKPQYFEQIPIPEISDGKKQELQSITNQIISKTKEKQKVQIQFLQLLESKFFDLKLTTKLQNWHELELKEFLKELQKAKIKLSLSEEAEWMNYFNEQKEKAQSLKSEIVKTDKEIDRMVYELYGLTEEEIKIVEESV